MKRREFLKKSIVGAAGASVPVAVAVVAMPESGMQILMRDHEKMLKANSLGQKGFIATGFHYKAIIQNDAWMAVIDKENKDAYFRKWFSSQSED
jgi:flagellar basal body rod protein FlgF